MKLIISLLLLIVAAPAYSQTWVSVAAPTKPLVAGFQLEQSQLSNHSWLYPFTQPTPEGVYQVSNLIVDRSGKAGVWSMPRTLTLNSGWYLYGGTWNQPVTADDTGIVWKVKVVSATQFPNTPYTPGSEHYFYNGWTGQYPNNVIAPYSGSFPTPRELKQDSRMLYRLSMLTYGGRNDLVAPAPVCYGGNLPLTEMDIAWCRVAETGETELSPAYHFTPPSIHDGWTMAQTCELPFGLQEQHQQGTLGYHVYVKLSGGVWQRIPAPHCYGEPSTADDWLFQWHDRQPTVRRLAANAPTHNPVAMPQSRLSNLQASLRNTHGNILVNPADAIEVTCPVIDEWRVGPWPFLTPTFGRRVAATDGGKWIIRQNQSLQGHRYWPVLAIENSYSIWDGVEVQATGGSAALSFSDFSGGQAFGNRFLNCNFFAPVSTTGLTFGILMDSKGTGQYGSHVASENRFFNTRANGHIPISIGGNQTAGVRLSETNITSLANDRRAVGVHLECPNQVVFSAGLNVDCAGGAIVRAAEYNAKLSIEGIWVDQGFACLLEACGVSCDMHLQSGKLNIRGSNPLLARLIDQKTVSRLSFSNVDVQIDGGVQGIYVTSGTYNLADLRFTDTFLSETVTLKEPTASQVTTSLRIIFYDPSLNASYVPAPGLRLTLPAAPAPSGFVGPIQGESIVFNSMTGRQQVKRENWID